MADNAAGSRDVSRLQDVLVTAVVALMGTAVALGAYMQAGFGVVPSLCVGSGLFIWLLSAHFLITRMRLKRLIDGRLEQLSQDVTKLKKEVEVTDLLAEGHNELSAGQDALEKALRIIVGRIDQYDSRIKSVYKLAKRGQKDKGEGAGTADLKQLSQQSAQLGELQGEFQRLSNQMQLHEHRYDNASLQQYTLMRAQLDVLELVVQQMSRSEAAGTGPFASQALEAIRGLRQLPGVMAPAAHAGHLAPPLPLVNPVAGPLGKPLAGGVAALPLAAAPQGGGAGLPPTAAEAAAMTQNEMSLKEIMAERPDADANGEDANETGEASEASQVEVKVAAKAAEQNEDAKAEDGTDGGSLLATINDAIEADRIELYLQPIVSLPSRELAFYEAFSRLRNDLGQLVLPRDFMPVAEAAELAPIIDNQTILRVIQVVQRLVERGKGRVVFCNLSLSSLRDAEFFAEFMDFMEANSWLSEHMVFEFSQDAMDEAGSFEHERLAAIAKLGFRFSMDRISQLDIDFKALAEMNFAFVKISASLLLGNMEGARAQIHSADLDHYLSRLNIRMIVDQVEREAVVRQLRDYNVKHSQGVLFCEPKPVRPEVFDNQSTEAA